MVGLLPLPRVWLPGNKQLLKEGPAPPHERPYFLPLQLQATRETTLFTPAPSVPPNARTQSGRDTCDMDKERNPGPGPGQQKGPEEFSDMKANQQCPPSIFF